MSCMVESAGSATSLLALLFGCSRACMLIIPNSLIHTLRSYFLVQGFGNVGSYASKFFYEAGAKVISVVEYDCTVVNPKGLDINALTEWVRSTFPIVARHSLFSATVAIMCAKGLALPRAWNIGDVSPSERSR